MNEIMNNILTRRSIRKLTDAPVSREILDDLVQACLLYTSFLKGELHKWKK